MSSLKSLILPSLVGLVLVVAVVGFLVNPFEKMRESRDQKRLEDLERLEKAIEFYLKNNAQDPKLCDSCQSGSLFSHQPLSSLAKSTSVIQSTGVGGSGWVPLDFSLNAGLNKTPLLSLPVDPINQDPYVYVFTVGEAGKFKLTSKFEAAKNAAIMAEDGGKHSDLYETGTDKSLAP